MSLKKTMQVQPKVGSSQLAPPPLKPNKLLPQNIWLIILAVVVIVLLILVLYFAGVFTTTNNDDDGGGDTPLDTSTKIVAGYAPMYAEFRKGSGWFAPFKIDPKMYTHLIVAFATLTTDGQLTLNDMKDDVNGSFDESIGNSLRQYTALRDGCKGDLDSSLPTDACATNKCSQIYKNFGANLHTENPKLKIILSIGGWNASGAEPSSPNGFSMFHDILVGGTPKRQTFINSCLSFVEKYDLDGIDLDIECPGAPQNVPLDDINLQLEKTGFTTLMQDLGKALHEKGKLLSFAAMVGDVIDRVYEWKALSEAVDFINLMTYDFHGSPYDEVTGPNTPLMTDFANSSHPKFNINYALTYILALGVNPAKLVLGLASYGRTFPMPDSTGFTASGSPYGKPYTKIPIKADGSNQCMQNATDGAWPGAIIQTSDWDLTQFDVFNHVTNPADLKADVGVGCGVGLFTVNQGSLAFYEIMDLIQNQKVPYKIDPLTSTAYTYIVSGGPDGPAWGADKTQYDPVTILVSFDTFETVATKCKFALDKKLGGVMIWSIGEDDMENNFAFSDFVSSYMTAKGKMAKTPETLQRDYLRTRKKTPVTCKDSCYTSDVCVGDNWSTPGTLGGYQQIGQQNCGCTWDWPRVMALKDIPKSSNSACAASPCVSMTPGVNCWMKAQDKIKTTGIGSTTNPCGTYYQTVFPAVATAAADDSGKTPVAPPADDPGTNPVPLTYKNYCGSSWLDANNRCHDPNIVRCENDAQCTKPQACYADIPCD